jgi:hypothetical protein
MRSLTSRTDHLGLLGAITGPLFSVYAVSKGPLSATIAADGWRVGGLAPTDLALLVHLAEEPFLVAMAVGFLGLAAGLGVRTVPADLGVAVTLSGFGLTVVTHVAEHLLGALTIPALFGAEDLFVWSYYLSWMVLYIGLALYGIAIGRSFEGPAWLAWLFVALLPGVVVVGGALVALDWFTLAGTFRLALGGTWTVWGLWLWRGRTGPAAVQRGAVTGRVGTERR